MQSLPNCDYATYTQFLLDFRIKKKTSHRLYWDTNTTNSPVLLYCVCWLRETINWDLSLETIIKTVV